MKRLLHYFCLAAAFAGLAVGFSSCDTSTTRHRGGLDPDIPDDPTRPGQEVSHDISMTNGYGEFYGQWYNDRSDSFLLYLYEGATDADGYFTGSAHMLTLDILLPKKGDKELKEGVYQCSDADDRYYIFIPAYQSKDEQGNTFLDGSTLYIQRDPKNYSTLAITDGQLTIKKLVTGQYQVSATVVADGAEYNFSYKGSIPIEDKTGGSSSDEPIDGERDKYFPGHDTYSLKAKALYNGEVYDGSDDYTLYLYYGEYKDNGDFVTKGTEMVFEVLTTKTGEMRIPAGEYACTSDNFTSGHFLDGYEENGTTYPSYVYRQYDNQGNYQLELVTGGTLTVSGSGSNYTVKTYFSTASGSFLCEYEGPIEFIDNRSTDVPKAVEMNSIARVVAEDCGQVWDGIETTDYRDWILYFYDKDAESSKEYTCVEILTQEKYSGELPEMKFSKVVQVGNPSEFVPGVIIGGFTEEGSNNAWGTWYCKGGTAWYAATKGSLDIKRDGEGYAFSFDFTDEDETYGGSFKGSYTGTVEFTKSQEPAGSARRSARLGSGAKRGAVPHAAARSGRRLAGQGRDAAVTPSAAAPQARTASPAQAGGRARVQLH